MVESLTFSRLLSSVDLMVVTALRFRWLARASLAHLTG
jgi:hypothetical protein